MKQTAVEWLVEELQLYYEGQSKLVYYEIIEQAKEMEKEQTLEFVRNAVRRILDEDRQNPFNLEKYYNETYKQD